MRKLRHIYMHGWVPSLFAWKLSQCCLPAMCAHACTKPVVSDSLYPWTIACHSLSMNLPRTLDQAAYHSKRSFWPRDSTPSPTSSRFFTTVPPGYIPHSTKSEKSLIRKYCFCRIKNKIITAPKQNPNFS